MRVMQELQKLILIGISEPVLHEELLKILKIDGSKIGWSHLLMFFVSFRLFNPNLAFPMKLHLITIVFIHQLLVQRLVFTEYF